MDLKGASEAMTQRAQQNALENKQKEQENEEQLKALETFGKALQKAGQIWGADRAGRRKDHPRTGRQRQHAQLWYAGSIGANHRLVTRLVGRVRSGARAIAITKQCTDCRRMAASQWILIAMRCFAEIDRSEDCRGRKNHSCVKVNP
jgi:hypothetical protein